MHIAHISISGLLAIPLVTIMAAAAITCYVLSRRLKVHGLQLAIAHEKAELENAARRAVTGELTATIVHQIKEPLAAIMTNANYSLRELNKDTPHVSEVIQALHDITADANRMDTVVLRIRRLFSKGPVERLPVRLNHVLRKVVACVREEANKSDVAIELYETADLPLIDADRVQLEQALMNVIMNSVEALRSLPKDQRQLRIRSLSGPDGVTVQVYDSGPGIGAADAERIFEPFFTTKSGGMGLGLSISRSIIESHGGQLTYVPTPRGALFEFLLPVEPQQDHE